MTLMIGNSDHRDQRAPPVYHHDELREVDLGPHLTHGITYSHRLSSVARWITIFYSSCCMPATVLASVDLSNTYSMQPFITATQSILIDFPTFISHVLGVMGEAKFSYDLQPFSAPLYSRYVSQSSILSRPCCQRVMYTHGSVIMSTAIMHVKLRGFPTSAWPK